MKILNLYAGIGLNGKQFAKFMHDEYEKRRNKMILEKLIQFKDRLIKRCPTESLEPRTFVCSYIPFCKYKTNKPKNSNLPECKLYDWSYINTRRLIAKGE